METPAPYRGLGKLPKQSQEEGCLHDAGTADDLQLEMALVGEVVFARHIGAAGTAAATLAARFGEGKSREFR